MRVGRTKGFARHNGAYTDPHERPKEMFVLPLRADARARLADPVDREQWTCRATPVTYTREELRALRALFAEMPDCRRGQGMKHKLASVLSVCALARLAGVSGPAATERFAKYLSQEELRALGAWRDPVAGRWVAPSDSTLCRVMADTDPDALADVLRRWAAPRTAPSGPMPALAADGKRIRGANRHTGEGVYFETVTLVTHEGRPLASRCCRDEGGELAATKALLDDVDVRGCVITLDALHTTYETERAIVDIHRADYLFTVKGNCPGTFAALDWNAPDVRHHHAPPEKGHGRVDRRQLDALTLPGRMLGFDRADALHDAPRRRPRRHPLAHLNGRLSHPDSLIGASTAQRLALARMHPATPGRSTLIQTPSGRTPRPTPLSNRTHPPIPTVYPAPTSSVKSPWWTVGRDSWP